MALYIVSTGIKGVSSMKLHRDLDVTQKTAWFLAHRIRKTWDTEHWRFEIARFGGPVEVDETYIGGSNKHYSKKLKAGRGPVGKTAVVGAKDRPTGQVQAQVVQVSKTLTDFVYTFSQKGSQVFTDDASAYRNLKDVVHKTVRHSAKEYVKGRVQWN